MLRRVSAGRIELRLSSNDFNARSHSCPVCIGAEVRDWKTERTQPNDLAE